MYRRLKKGETIMKSRLVKSCLFIGLAIFLALAATNAWAAAADCGGVTACSCGNNVVADRVLVSGVDPITAAVCPADGLAITIDGVVLDLGGNTLTGAASGTGVLIKANAVKVINGSVLGFGKGVAVGTSTTGSEVSDIKAKNNKSDGIRLVGDTNTLADNKADSNGGDGIHVNGDGNHLEKNKGKKNQSDGIRVTGHTNTLEKNKADKNGADGLHINGDGNALERNKGKKNKSDGISITGLSNDLVKNQGDKNGRDGIHVNGDENTLADNKSTKNDRNGIFADGTGNDDVGGNQGSENGGVDCEIDGVACIP